MLLDGPVNSWDGWLASLPVEVAARAVRLRERLEAAGCPDAELWVVSEVDGGIPQAARYRFLSSLWPKVIDSWREGIDRLPAAQPLRHQGVDRDDLVRLARAVAYETVFAMLYHLADDAPSQAVERLPGWRLLEVDDEGRPSGRTLDNLFEDLLTMDPSGLEGTDIVPPLAGPWNQLA